MYDNYFNARRNLQELSRISREFVFLIACEFFLCFSGVLAINRPQPSHRNSALHSKPPNSHVCRKQMVSAQLPEWPTNHPVTAEFRIISDKAIYQQLGGARLTDQMAWRRSTACTTRTSRPRGSRSRLPRSITASIICVLSPAPCSHSPERCPFVLRPRP